MKKTYCIMITCLLLIVCGCEKQSNDPLRTEIVTLQDGRPAYAADLQQYGEKVAGDYYIWRNQGNPDFFEQAVPYENGVDITLTLSPHVYHISQNNETWWSIDVSTTLPDEQIGEWSHLVNLDRMENGTWVRQGILWDSYMYIQCENAVEYVRRIWDGYPVITPYSYSEVFGKRTLTVDPTTVVPALSPGQYRFVFYVAVIHGTQTEYRQYYLPFTVTE